MGRSSSRLTLSLCLSLPGAVALAQAPAPFSAEGIPGIVDAKGEIPDLQVELKYSTPQNFIGRDVYGDLETCYLHADAARMLKAAEGALRKGRPDLRLRVYDCLRPRQVQLVMWEVVKDTPQRGYVANPHTKTGSLHNYGCAVDLTLATADGAPLDMGTPFDFFGPLAQPRKELELLVEGTLSHPQLANRLLLRSAMVEAGFFPLASEWWHFNCATPSQTRAKYQIVP